MAHADRPARRCAGLAEHVRRDPGETRSTPRHPQLPGRIARTAPVAERIGAQRPVTSRGRPAPPQHVLRELWERQRPIIAALQPADLPRSSPMIRNSFRSTSTSDTASASPIRRPVASIHLVRSGRSLRRARGSDSSAVSRPLAFLLGQRARRPPVVPDRQPITAETTVRHVSAVETPRVIRRNVGRTFALTACGRVRPRRCSCLLQ